MRGRGYGRGPRPPPARGMLGRGGPPVRPPWQETGIRPGQVPAVRPTNPWDDWAAQPAEILPGRFQSTPQGMPHHGGAYLRHGRQGEPSRGPLAQGSFPTARPQGMPQMMATPPGEYTREQLEAYDAERERVLSHTEVRRSMERHNADNYDS